MDDPSNRQNWINLLERISRPLLSALAEHRLKRDMPIEQHPSASGRADVTHLEAVGRLLCGIAPWLGSEDVPDAEKALQRDFRAKVRFGLSSITDPNSPDRVAFDRFGQPLVDAAFLSHAIIRAPILFDSLDDAAKKRLLDALESSRSIAPHFNNWLLFSAMVEAALCRLGRPWDRMRVDYAIRQHLQWYKGDGVYGDGPEHHNDYYNSFVIQPMLVDVIETTKHLHKEQFETILKRSIRYAGVLEKSISPEGAIPVLGRSLAYRMGTLQHLAQMALRKQLPEGITPAQVRCALWSVIDRCMSAPGTFDANGWLRIGFAGHQPNLGESYISTGSLYLCAAALLPLGLPASDRFWSDPPAKWTSAKVYAGEDVMADKSM